jgi:hypothetical protein
MPKGQITTCRMRCASSVNTNVQPHLLARCTSLLGSCKGSSVKPVQGAVRFRCQAASCQAGRWCAGCREYLGLVHWCAHMAICCLALLFLGSGRRAWSAGSWLLVGHAYRCMGDGRIGDATDPRMRMRMRHHARVRRARMSLCVVCVCPDADPPGDAEGRRARLSAALAQGPGRGSSVRAAGGTAHCLGAPLEARCTHRPQATNYDYEHFYLTFDHRRSLAVVPLLAVSVPCYGYGYGPRARVELFSSLFLCLVRGYYVYYHSSSSAARRSLFITVNVTCAPSDAITISNAHSMQAQWPKPKQRQPAQQA